MWAHSILAALLALVAGTAVGACQRATVPPDVSPSPAVTPPAAAPSPPTAAPPATARAALSPTPMVTPGEPRDVAWSQLPPDVFTVEDTISDTASGAAHVAVGATDEGGLAFAAAWHSTDGSRWQAANLAEAELATLEAVTDGPAGLVAVGFYYGGEAIEAAIWRSPDGVTWQRVTGALGGGQMSAVAAGPTGYVALGSDPDAGNRAVAWASVDGANWTGVAVSGIEPDASINGLAWLGDAFIAYGASATEQAAMWLSTDGREWQAVAALESQPSSTIHDLAIGPSRVVAVGATYQREPPTALFWSSADARSWEPFEGERLVGEAFTVTPLGSGFVAAGARDEARLVFSATVWISADGLAWERQPDDASFAMARITELLTGAAGVIALGERALDESAEELEPVVWLGTPR